MIRFLAVVAGFIYAFTGLWVQDLVLSGLGIALMVWGRGPFLPERAR